MLVFSDVEIDWARLSIAKVDVFSQAEARIGRPLTPMSYAGVARRTARRTVRRTSVMLATLPPGCIYGPAYGAYYYNCNGTYYEQQNNTYVQVIVQ